MRGVEDETSITLFARCKGISRELGSRYRGTISAAKFADVSRSLRGVVPWTKPRTSLLLPRCITRSEYSGCSATHRWVGSLAHVRFFEPGSCTLRASLGQLHLSRKTDRLPQSAAGFIRRRVRVAAVSYCFEITHLSWYRLHLAIASKSALDKKENCTCEETPCCSRSGSWLH